MTQVKFYRVETLPETGEVGSLYFVYKGASPKFYVCTTNGFEQYSDLFSRNFSTLLVDAMANAGDGVVYFTPDTCEIIKDGVKYGSTHSEDYATKQWVEDQNYLTEHQDISGKVDVEDFEEATKVTSAALNLFHRNTLWQTEDTYVKCDKSKTLEEAISGESDIIYFTTDSHQIVLNGVVYNLLNSEDYAAKQWVEEALNNKQDKSDSLLETDDKTVIGAINELNAKIDEYVNLNYTTISVEINVEGNANPYDGSEIALIDLSTDIEERLILNGISCSFLVLQGHEYKVELLKMPDYYRVIGNKVKIANGDYQQYPIEVLYCADDRFVVLSNGRLFTWQNYQDAGTLPSNATPVLLYMNNSVLEENNGSFYLPIQLMKAKLPAYANWGGADSEDVPELANAASSSSNTGEYDMERNTTIIVNRYLTDCAAYVATQQVLTINGVDISGWLGTAEQYALLLANNYELLGWFTMLGINTSFFTASLAGWTSSELARSSSSEVVARIIVNGALNTSPKQRSTTAISVLPFYKDIH